MSRLVKIAALVYLIGLITLSVLLPIGAITVLAKVTGAPFSWAVACIPLFVALCCLPPVLISKIIIELAVGSKK